MRGIEWALLNAETVKVDGSPIDLPKRARQVLLRLLLEPNAAVSTDQLADALWADDELPKSIPNSVARFVSDLRRTLGPFGERVTTTTGSYRLLVEPGELDIDSLDQAASSLESALATPSNGAPGDSAAGFQASVHSLQQVIDRVGIASNQRLADMYGIESIVRSHEELRTGAIETLARALSRQQLHWQAVALIERTLAEYPYHEQFLRLLVQTLTDAGRTLDAASASDRLTTLRADIGVEDPTSIRAESASNRRRDLRQSETETGRTFTSAMAASSRGDRRRHDATPLIGRIEDLRAVRRLLDEHRFVTVVGLGGTGKTRLAASLAQALDEVHPVYRVDLRPVDDPHVIVPLAASALGMPPTADLDSHVLADRVAGHQFTLIIDNCEHLVEAVTALISAILRAAPGAQILATSRQTLGVPAEHTYVLAPLGVASVPAAIDPSTDATPSNQSAGPPSQAAELFLARTHGRLGASPEQDQLDQVEAICRELNGLPLAIEIAAAQLSIMTLDQLEHRTATPLGTAGTRSFAEPAVTAVDEALDWAWSNLAPSQQALLARLSVFASGWTETAARAVRADPGSLTADLDRLVSLSLIQINGGLADPDSSHGVEQDRRYSMLVPVRDYAAARLDERAETSIMRDRLAAWALDLTAQWSFPEHHVWSGPNDELEPEHGNILAALTHLEANQRIEELVTLAAASSGMMVNRGFAADLIRRLTPHVSNDTVAPHIRGEALFGLGAAYHAVGDLDVLSEIGQTCIELADGNAHDWVPVMAGYTSVWSLVAPVGFTTDELSAMAYEAAEQSTSRRLNLGLASLYRAHIEFVSRNYDEALRLFQEAEELVERPGRGLLVIEIGISLSLFMQGHIAEARASTSRWRSRNDTDHWHYILEVARAIVMGGTGDATDAAEATQTLSASVRALPEAGAWGRAGLIQTAYAILADRRGEPDLATELFASAVNRDILLISVAISHVMQTRGVSGDDAWLEVGIEFWTRVVPPDSVAATATSTPQLLSWWSGGDASPRT